MKRVINWTLIGLLLCTSCIITSCDIVNSKLTSEIYPSSGGTVSPAQGSYEKGVVVQIEATPNPGYRFDHWEGSLSGTSSNAQLAMDGNKKVIAYFKKQYSLNVSVTPSSSGSVSPGRVNTTRANCYSFSFTF
jgi:hypothetical protein